MKFKLWICFYFYKMLSFAFHYLFAEYCFEIFTVYLTTVVDFRKGSIPGIIWKIFAVGLSSIKLRLSK